MRPASIVLCLAVAASAGIVDRIAITVGRDVITELQLDEELRVTAFLNHRPIARDNSARHAAADRLIQQLIVRREMEVSRYPLPDAEDVTKYFDQIRGGFAEAVQFEQALAAYSLTDEILRDHLALQLTTLRFIEFRFQPEVNVTDAEIRSAYLREVANWKAEHSGAVAPSFDASRESIRKALAEERIDRALDAWLQARLRREHIVYMDTSVR
jgi:hypothetical protein